MKYKLLECNFNNSPLFGFSLLASDIHFSQREIFAVAATVYTSLRKVEIMFRHKSNLLSQRHKPMLSQCMIFKKIDIVL